MDRELRKSTFRLIDEIEKIHSNYDGNIISESCDMEQKVMDNLNVLIWEHGHDDLFICKAALDACNNWHTMKLVRNSMFSMDLEDGLKNHGSLATDRTTDWIYLQRIAECNPEMYFIEDMDLLYDTICNAIEQGDDDVAYMATVVRDIIWEPENPIEED